MATVPKFGSFKPKPRSTSTRGQDAGPSGREREPAHDSETRSTVENNDRVKPERRRTEDAYDGSRRPHPSDDRHHHHRRAQQEREPRKDVIPAPEVEESDLFIADRRGDSKNVEYGNLHRYSVPQYRRCGYGHLVGAPANVKINRDESTEKVAVLSRDERQGGQRNSRPLGGKFRSQHERTLRVIRPAQPSAELETQSGFIAFRSTLKRKRGSASPEQGASKAVDYRSIEGKAKPSRRPLDDDLTHASDSDADEAADDLELRMRQDNAIMVRRTKERPSDPEVWLALIDHQANVTRPDASTSAPTGTEKRTLADVRLSIYDQALKHIGMGTPGHDVLVLGMINEGSLIWDRSKLTAKWTEVLKASPGSIPLWTRYLDFVQTDHIGFKYEKCKKAYVKCLKILHNARATAPSSETHDIITAQLYVFLRLTAFVRDAGYDEVAYALWQLMLECTAFRPLGLHDQKTALDSLEDFWDSEVPRIGEEAAQGWLHYVQHGGTTTRSAVSTGIRPFDSARPFLSFAEQEAEQLSGLHLPATADDDAAMADPFRHVMFSDMQEVIETLLDEFPGMALTNAFLTFMRLPPVPDDGSGSVSHEWQADQFLRTETAGVNSNRRPAVGIVTSEQPTTFALFHQAFDAFQGRLLGHDSSSTEVDNFIDRALERLVSAHSGADRLAEYYIAFKLQFHPGNAAKTAKQLLRARPSSLRLYNAYALTEARRESRMAKAEEVWSAAIEMSSSLDEDVRDDVVLLWHSWVLTNLVREDYHHALHIVLCMSDGRSNAKDCERSNLTVTASQRLKATQHFGSSWEQMLYKGQYGHAVLFAECSMLFDYLADSLALDVGLATNERYRARLERLDSPAAAELLHQAQASLLKLHINRRRSYKPAIVREVAAEGIRRFPNNSAFLELYARVQAHFQIEDRIRASLRDQVLSGSRASIVSWSFALAEELRRCTAEVSGSTENSVRSTFARALLQPDSEVKHSLALWTMWFCFEHPSRYDHARSSWSLTDAQRKQALQRARQVFMDGLRSLPWCKAWVIMGLHAFARDGGLSPKELRQVYDVLGERELRVRVGSKEMEDAIAEIDDA
ncbi:hypothetical protein LTR85_000115 [Meristemomyces frigidus]|nr:hypothetical protein LTR85_000115 [Meristemomyces frigidus]